MLRFFRAARIFAGFVLADDPLTPLSSEPLRVWWRWAWLEAR